MSDWRLLRYGRAIARTHQTSYYWPTRRVSPRQVTLVDSGWGLEVGRVPRKETRNADGRNSIADSQN